MKHMHKKYNRDKSKQITKHIQSKQNVMHKTEAWHRINDNADMLMFSTYTVDYVH